MPKYLSDAEMAALEQQHASAAPKAVLSDAEMDALEKAHASVTSNPAQTALESYGNTATLGYLPHLQAAAEPAMNSVLNAITGNNVKSDPYLQRRDDNISRQRIQEQQNPDSALAGKAAGFGATLLAGSGIPSVVAQSALQNPGDIKGEMSGAQLQDRGLNTALAALIGGGLKGAGAILGKGADWTMQKAVNMARPKAGMGTKLLEQGIVGTGPMMESQISKAIPKISSNLSKTAAQGGDIEVSNLINSLKNKAESLKIEGVLPKNARPSYREYTQLADDLTKMSKGASSDLVEKQVMGAQIPAGSLQKFKQIQGDVAHTAAGNAGTSAASEAALEAMRGSRQSLSSKLGAPYEEANAALSALIRGKQGLQKSSSLSNIALKSALAGLGAYSTGSPEGALLGLGLNTNLAKSVGAHGLNLAAKGLSKSAIPVARGLSLFKPTSE